VVVALVRNPRRAGEERYVAELDETLAEETVLT
jgi:hypothetical protein